MSDRTGIGPLEIAVLGALASLGATADRLYVKCNKVLEALEHVPGYGPRYAYDVLCDLARPWRAPISLVDFHGNYGGKYFPPAAPELVESRLTPMGELVLASEQGRIGPLPIGMLNGTYYQGGTRPALDAQQTIAVLLALLGGEDLTDEEIGDRLGPPHFPDGCDLDGDLAALLAGKRTPFRLAARLVVTESQGRRAIEVSHFPPELWADPVVDALQAHVSETAWRTWVEETFNQYEVDRLPIAFVREMTSGYMTHRNELVQIGLEDDADPTRVIERLNDPNLCDHFGGHRIGLFGTWEAVTLDFQVPIPDQLREWALSWRGDAAESLEKLRSILN